MDENTSRAWRRGAVALALPGFCLLALALLCVRGAASRQWGDRRIQGIVTNLNESHNRGYQPTIEYSVEGKKFQFHTGSNYSAETFTVGQKVTVLYPPGRPEFGMLESFGELWPLPIFLTVVSLIMLGLAWKARTGLPPPLHALCSFALTILGALVGMMVFGLLCTPGGFDIFAGAPRLVTLLGGILIFFGTVPVGALGAAGLWHKHVPARCPHCRGPARSKLVGKQLTYTCPSCGRLL